MVILHERFKGTLTKLEAFSPEVEKRYMQVFQVEGFGVCDAFLHTKLADRLEMALEKKHIFNPSTSVLSRPGPP